MAPRGLGPARHGAAHLAHLSIRSVRVGAALDTLPARTLIGGGRLLRQLFRGWWWILLAALALQAAPAQAADNFHFKLPPGPPPVALNPAVLSDDERVFLAGLPEIRVALQRVGAPPFERVDDDGEISGLQPEMLGTLARALGRMGYAVEQAALGDQALARWRAGGVRLLITDLRMPGLSGQALAQAIRAAEAADETLGRTAIVFCSGDVPPLAAEAGTLADAFIGKPVELATLADTLRALLGDAPGA